MKTSPVNYTIKIGTIKDSTYNTCLNEVIIKTNEKHFGLKKKDNLSIKEKKINQRAKEIDRHIFLPYIQNLLL